MNVIGLGAICELDSQAECQIHFRVSEFAVLDDGRELTLHNERGLMIGARSATDLWAWVTFESLEHDVLNVVLPDDAEVTGDEHPWAWLRELLVARGVDAPVEHLQSVPYVVRFGPKVQERLTHVG